MLAKLNVTEKALIVSPENDKKIVTQQETSEVLTQHLLALLTLMKCLTTQSALS